MNVVDLGTASLEQEMGRFLNRLYPGYPRFASSLPRREHEHQHDKVAQLAVVLDGEIRSRVTLISAAWADEISGTKTAYFKDFESNNCQDSVRMLFCKARDIAQDWAVDRLLGPMTPHVSDARGVLTTGHELGPTIGLAFTPAYYGDLLSACGFSAARELYSYLFRSGDMDHLEPVVRFVKLRNRSLRLEEMDFTNSSDIARRICELYNAAWKGAWHFMPLDPQKLHSVIEESKVILDKRMNFFLMDGERAVGMFLALPNIFLEEGGSGSAYRGALFGVSPEYQKRGLDILMAYTGYKRAIEAGVSALEIGWVLESNKAWVQQIKKMLGPNYVRKSFTIYEHELCPV